MNKKFVCLECGCHNVEGEIPAMVDVKIDSQGNFMVESLEWEFNGEGLVCTECGSCEIAEIGKKKVY
jgi:hypothetical protein